MLYIVTHLNISFPSYFVAGFAKTTYSYARANYRAAYVRYINDKDLRWLDLKMLSLYSFLWTVMDESVKGKTDKINPASGRDPKTLCQMCVDVMSSLLRREGVSGIFRLCNPQPQSNSTTSNGISMSTQTHTSIADTCTRRDNKAAFTGDSVVKDDPQ